MNFHGLSIDKTWTLFLDRDGVINERIVGGYATSWDEFRLIEGVEEAIRKLSDHFGHIIVVTNQQGIGKGLMTAEQVTHIHRKMVAALERSGGKIDAVYFSPHLESQGHPDRKPGIGMALKAQDDFPGIRLERSVMVGDSLSDMQFGRNCGMVNVLVGKPEAQAGVPTEFVDLYCTGLEDFSGMVTGP